jgi:uncharacterized protein Yka (UPF0111/DUF47 family)
MQKLITLIVDSVTELAKATACLKDMTRIDLIQLSVVHVHRLESEADQVYRSALAELFSPEHVAPAVDLVRDKDILETLENAADMCHHAMTTIRAVVVKNL